MFVREKHINGYTYLYLVETVREDGRAKQRIIKNLGRKEAVVASGGLGADVSPLIRVSLPVIRDAKQAESIKHAGCHGATPTNLCLRGCSSPPQAHSKPRHFGTTPAASIPQRRPTRTFTNTHNQLRHLPRCIAYHKHHELAISNPVPEQSPPHAHLVHQLYHRHPEPLQQWRSPSLLVHTLGR